MKPQQGDFEIELLQRHKKGSIVQKILKDFDPETVNLPSGTKIYINESLCSYYKKQWPKHKKLWDAKHTLVLVSNGSIRIKLKKEAVSIIINDCYLTNLLPDDPLFDNY